MSEKFATQTPFRLSKKLFDLQKKNSETESALAAANEKIVAANSELSALRATLDAQLSAHEEKRSELLKTLSELEQQARQKSAELEANLEASGKSLAEKNAECVRLEKALEERDTECLELQAAIKESEERAGRRIAEFEETLSDREKAFAEKAAECGHLVAALKAAEDRAERRVAEFEAALTEREQAVAEKESECANLRAVAQIEKEKKECEIAELEIRLREKEAESFRLREEIRASEERCRSAIATKGKELAEQENRAASLQIALKTAEENGARKVAQIESELAQRVKQISGMHREQVRLATALDKEKLQARADKKRSEEEYRKLVIELEDKLKSTSAALQAKANASESQARAARETIAAQVGEAMLHALKSPGKALALPSTLWKIHKEGESRIPGKELRAEIANQGPRFKEMLKILQESGLPGLQRYFSTVKLSINSQVLALTALAKESYATSPRAAIDAGREAFKLDPKTYRAKWLAFRLAEQDSFDEAAQFLSGLVDTEFSASEKRRAKEIRLRAHARPTEVAEDSQSGIELAVESKVGGSARAASNDGKPDLNSGENGGRQKLSIEELRTRLWSGFSSYALKELNDLANDADVSEADRQACLWHTASWQYFTQDYQAAFNTLSLSSKSDRHCVLLLIQTLVKLSRAEDALAEVDAAIARFGKKTDFLLMRSTALRLCGTATGESFASREKAQLKQLNSVFIREALAPLKLKTQKSRLTIRNVACDLPLGNRSFGPKVSIIVPVYNGESTIDIAIESLLRQTHQNVEVIVVDDCSTDRTVQLVRDFAAKDSRLKLIIKDTNEGAYASRNRGLKAATGDYIMVNDSDDWSHPQKIEIQLEKLKENASCVAVMSYWVRVTENLEILGSWRSRRGASSSLLDLNFSSLMFRREILRKLKAWDQVKVGADAEFRSRIEALFGEHSVFLIKNKVLSLSLVREDSLTRSKSTHVSSTFFGLRWQYRDIYRYRHSLSKKAGSTTGISLPVPLGNISNSAAGGTPSFDAIVVSDFALSGKVGARVIGQVAELCRAGKKVAVLHWRHYELDPGTPLNSALYGLCHEYSVSFITHGDTVNSSVLLYGCSSILEHVPDSLPQILCEKICVVEGGFAGSEDYKRNVVRQNVEIIHKRPVHWIAAGTPIMQLFKADPVVNPAMLAEIRKV